MFLVFKLYRLICNQQETPVIFQQQEKNLRIKSSTNFSSNLLLKFVFFSWIPVELENQK